MSEPQMSILLDMVSAVERVAEQEKWHRRFLRIADEVATWSKDPTTQVGAVVVRDRRILSTGYNGFPRGVRDRPDLLENREEKYSRTVHAELNAILNARVSLEGATLYTTLQPCNSCALAIIQAGLSEIVFYSGYPERWSSSISLGMDLLLEAGIEARGYERETDESPSDQGSQVTGRDCC